MEDKEIVQRILRHGETQCYSLIVKRYSGMVFSKAISLMKREDLAQEITQQTFIRAYTNLDSWHGDSLGAWMLSIAAHLSLNTLDKIRRERTEFMDESKWKEPEPEDDEEHETLIQILEKSIKELPPDDQKIIRLHYYKGKKTAEIAQLTGLTPSNVLVKLHRIRKLLKKQIDHERNK